MKIGMQTWGSHGDVRPFVALAEGLQAAGHQVTVLVTCLDNPAYDEMASANGVTIQMVASPVISAEEAEAVGLAAYRNRNPMAQMADILRFGFAPAEQAMFAAAQRLCAESDLVIGHYFMHPLQIAAEKAGVPYVSVLLSHVAVPSAYSHPMPMPSLGKTGNRLVWRLICFALNSILLPYSNRLRAQIALPPVQDAVTQVWISSPLTLLAVSPQLCQPQPDWPAPVRTCGFLDMPNMALEGQVPPVLAAFLQKGDAPVYMGLGSWMPKDVVQQTATLQLLTRAATLAGCRAIIQSPSWQDCGFQSSDQILYVNAAPHHLIFPHCQAVVHHGGAGTTQSATLAGKPSIVVAHISEQEHWALELRRIGIAGKHSRRRNVRARQLARQIRQVQNTPAMAVKAEAVAQRMRQENGVAEAVKLIAQQFGNKK
ncbi:glycosyltransferase [Undibacterium sp.]|uniref:glycosyltransferase n=1 Tax=Undibacterium sp. TaxID=1914977 RepID=UPI00374CF76E